MMTKNEYLPFRAINVFIDDVQLKKILEDILKNIETLPKEDQIYFAKHFKEYVNILGFRNPLHAPLSLQINAYTTAFEDKDEVVPFTLSTWTKIEADFAEKVESWLESQGWEDLQLERKFGEDQGFIQEWPASLTFDQIVEDFKKENPGLDFDNEDLIMMVLWLSGKLPEEETGL